MNTSDARTQTLEPRWSGLYAFIAVAGIVTAGSATLLYLAGLSTFDTGLYWDDHIFLGRIMTSFAIILPVLALIARLGRPFIILSVATAVLYFVQNGLTFVDVGPVGALHALNAFPLILLPAFAAVRAYEVVRKRG